jgi:hypothetical protein
MRLHAVHDAITRFATLIGMVRDHLMLVRVPLLLVAAAAVLALRVDQIAELFFLLGQSGERPLLQAFSALAMAFALGFAVWYTSRILFRFRFPPRPLLGAREMSPLRTWLPRLLGAGIPALMAIACIGQAIGLRHDSAAAEMARLLVYAGILLAEAVVIFFVVVFRRRFARAIAGRMAERNSALGRPTSAAQRSLRRMPETPQSDRTLAKFGDLEPFGRWVLIVGASFNIVLLLAAWWAPESIAWSGSIAIILLTALCFTLTGGLVLIFTERYAFPIVILIVLVAIAWQALAINDNHHVRQTASMRSWQTAKVATSADLPDGYRALGERLSRLGDEPVFLVSAEGGGIRAAAWTALVLSRIEAQSGGRFGRHVIAASGVSGGSLGIATYAAMLDLERSGKLQSSDFICEPDQAAMASGDRCPARAFLTRDYLKPVLVNMLIVDQAQRWIPYAFLPDRGSELEYAWERGWNALAAKPLGTGNTFRDSWRKISGGVDQPWLLFNSTIVATGQRFIEQPLGFDANVFDVYFPGAIDGSRRLGAETPLSAVVHNSARFTYMSPAGTLDAPTDQPALGAIQLVDGGYFENSGTATLAGVYRLLTEDPATATPGFPVNPKRIFVIHISNDPAVPGLLADGSDRCSASSAHNAGNDHYGEIVAPAFALLNTREGRGEVARRTLARTTAGNFFHFRLCEGAHHLPLGWTLSSAAWLEMDRQLGNHAEATAAEPEIASNADQLARISAMLSSTSTQSGGARPD